MEIKTNRLVIRNLRLNDLEDFYFYRSNPDVTKYQGFDVMTLQQARDFIQDQIGKESGCPGEWIQYGIENKTSGRIIGDCAIKFYEDVRIAETGITISHTEQRKGYAKEALRGILNFLFNIPGFHRVVEITDVENTSSIQLLKSLGFRLEGHFIKNIFFKGNWGSEYQFAMLKEEWENNTLNKQKD